MPCRPDVRAMMGRGDTAQALLLSPLPLSAPSPSRVCPASMRSEGGGGDPSSWLLTPPQLLTSKEGHSSFCLLQADLKGLYHVN